MSRMITGHLLLIIFATQALGSRLDGDQQFFGLEGQAYNLRGTFGKYKGNLIGVIKKDAMGEIQEIVKLQSGNFALRVKLKDGTGSLASTSNQAAYDPDRGGWVRYDVRKGPNHFSFHGPDQDGDGRWERYDKIKFAPTHVKVLKSGVKVYAAKDEKSRELDVLVNNANYRISEKFLRAAAQGKVDLYKSPWIQIINGKGHVGWVRSDQVLLADLMNEVVQQTAPPPKPCEDIDPTPEFVEEVEESEPAPAVQPPPLVVSAGTVKDKVESSEDDEEIDIEREYQKTKERSEFIRAAIRRIVRKDGRNGDWEYLTEFANGSRDRDRVEWLKNDKEWVHEDDDGVVRYYSEEPDWWAEENEKRRKSGKPPLHKGSRIKRIQALAFRYVSGLPVTDKNMIGATWTMFGEARGEYSKNTRRDPMGRAEMMATITILYNRAYRRRPDDPLLWPEATRAYQFSSFNYNDLNWARAILGPENLPYEGDAYERTYQAYVEWKFPGESGVQMDPRLDPQSRRSQNVTHYLTSGLDESIRKKKKRYYEIPSEIAKLKANGGSTGKIEKLEKERAKVRSALGHWIFTGKKLEDVWFQPPPPPESTERIILDSHVFYQGVP